VLHRQGRRNVEGGRCWQACLANVPMSENAVGARNLTKAAAARKGCRSRFGSYSEGEPSLREMNQEATPWITAGVENLEVDCRFTRHNHREGSLKQSGDTSSGCSERRANPTRERPVGGNTDEPTGTKSTSKPFGDDAERRSFEEDKGLENTSNHICSSPAPPRL
jgi:hypothetical protein